MRRIVLSCLALLFALCVGAKVIKISMADGSTRVFASAQLESIEFGNNGTLTVTTYDGRNIDMEGARFDIIDIDDEAEIYNVTDTTVTSMLDQSVHQRLRKIDVYYPTSDPWGQPITQSGCILIPQEVWEGKRACDGMLLVNHFTSTQKKQSPTRGYFGMESMFVASPLQMSYITVASDFYGFGATERYPQAFVQGTANGRASIDFLFTARKLLKDMGVDYGPLLFNIGYSSGGYDALATQKVRDMEYRDEIFFDKTFAGGGPYDLPACYDEFLTLDNSAFCVGVAMTMVATNETQRLGISYGDMFKKPLDEKLSRWILEKKLHQFTINDSIAKYASKMSDVLTPNFLDANQPMTRSFLNALQSLSLMDGWTPDTSQKIYLAHARDDSFVPFSAAHPMLEFLKKSGYENNIYAGRTNLQSNFAFKQLGHIGVGVIYAFETMFALKAWPVIYDENRQLKPQYASVLAQEMSSPLALWQMMHEAGIETSWLRGALANGREMAQQFLGDPDSEEGEGSEPEESADGSDSSLSLLDVLEAYVGLYPEDDAEEAAMIADIGADPRTYIKRLRRLLVLLGVLG